MPISKNLSNAKTPFTQLSQWSVYLVVNSIKSNAKTPSSSALVPGCFAAPVSFDSAGELAPAMFASSKSTSWVGIWKGLVFGFQLGWSLEQEWEWGIWHIQKASLLGLGFAHQRLNSSYVWIPTIWDGTDGDENREKEDLPSVSIFAPPLH